MPEIILAVLIALAIAPIVFTVLPIVFIIGVVLILVIWVEFFNPPNDKDS